MSKNKWSQLRGEELSAFAASPAAKDEGEDFAAHLENYGSEQDFYNVIEQFEKPLIQCFNVFYAHPTAASNWLSNKLATSSSSTDHFNAAMRIAHDALYLRSSSAKMVDILDFVDHHKVLPEHRSILFESLVRGHLFDALQKHWDVYQPTAQKNAKEYVLLAATHGWDLRSHLNWSPKPHEIDEYFQACCEGGLLECAQQWNITDHNTLTESFASTAVRSFPPAHDVLNYLWDNHPNTRWESNKDVLKAIVYMPPDLAQKVVDHHHQCAPQKMEKEAVWLTSYAIEENNSVLFDCVFPHLNPKDHYKAMATAIGYRKKVWLKTLLQKPNAQKNFHKALKASDASHQQWAAEVYANMQNTTLRKQLKNIPAAVVKRKM